MKQKVAELRTLLYELFVLETDLMDNLPLDDYNNMLLLERKERIDKIIELIKDMGA